MSDFGVEQVFDAICKDDLSKIKQLWRKSSSGPRLNLVNLREAKTNRTPLHYTTEKGLYKMTVFLLEKGADINAVDEKLWTPLHAACSSGFANIIYYLLKHGAKVVPVSDSGCIPLNYFLRHCQEENRLLTLACLSLLLPSPGHLAVTNSRGESLLHYACLNNSQNMPLFVAFLLLNGVDPNMKTKKGNLCWEFLTADKLQLLGTVMDTAKYNIQIPSVAIDFGKSFLSQLPSYKPVQFIARFEEDDDTKLLKQLIRIRKDLEGESQSAKIKDAIVACEKSINILRPDGATESLHKLQQLGEKFCTSILKQNNISLTNKTARKLKSEGKMYVCLGHDNNTFEHVYYFLFNDVLLLFEDKSIRLKTLGKQTDAQLLKIIPISSLHSYSIPENHGLVNACQIVFYPIEERVRQCFTVLFPSSEDKESFNSTLETSYNQITRYHISYPINEIPEQDKILREGYLVKKGIVLNNYVKMYVRLTSNFLYYYEHPLSAETIGKISLEGLIFKVDNKRKILRWSHKDGRSYSFLAITDNEFSSWKETIKGRANIRPSMMEFKVRVKVLAGRNLAAMDPSGKSDPYCILGLVDQNGNYIKGQTKHKTDVEYKTLKPCWTKNNKFTFSPFANGQVCGIRIEVWDEDKISADDFMGQLTLDPDTYYKSGEISVWMPLQMRKGKEKEDAIISGDLYIQISSCVS